MRQFAEELVVPSILKEGGPTKPPMKDDVQVAASIIVMGQPTRPPLPGQVIPKVEDNPE